MSAMTAELPAGFAAAMLRGDLSWQDRASCAGADPEAFFPGKGGSTREAKQVCRGCEVRAECLEYALDMERGSPWTVSGVWGGLSAQERAAVRAMPPAPPQASPRPEPPAPGDPERCDVCGYLRTPAGHRLECGDS